MKGNGEECTKEPTCDRHKEVLQGKFILRRREKKDQEGHQKNCISTKGTDIVSLDFGVVGGGVFLAEAPLG